MKNYKASQVGDNSYLKSYYFLLKIQYTVIALIEKIGEANLNASYSINEIIGESASLRRDIKEWLEALYVTKFDNSVLIDLIDELDERCLEIQAERAAGITTPSRPQRILIKNRFIRNKP